MKALMLPATNRASPASRQRVYETAPRLAQYGITTVIFERNRPGLPPGAQELWRWVRLIPLLLWCDVVFIQRLLLRPRSMDLIRLLNRRIIYNFDDAWFTSPPEALTPDAVITDRAKRMQHMIRSSASILVPNRFLASYASHHNDNVSILPVPVNCDRFCPIPKTNKQRGFIVGWVGRSDATLPYIKRLVAPLQRLAISHPLTLRLVGVSNAKLIRDYFSTDLGFEVEFVEWIANDADVPAVIGGFDVGVVPLLEDDWSRGKFPLKALEYMAVGIPMVCTPIGIDTDIMIDGQNCMLAATDDEWVAKLRTLADNVELCQRMGQAARETVVSHYSFEVVTTALVDELQRVARLPRWRRLE